jgi:hypothetical protein
MTRTRRGAAPLPAKTRAVLADAQTRMTVRMLLANGATETTIGPIVILRMPGSQIEQRFDYATVQSVKQDASRWATERRLGASEGNPDVG